MAQRLVAALPDYAGATVTDDAAMEDGERTRALLDSLLAYHTEATRREYYISLSKARSQGSATMGAVASRAHACKKGASLPPVLSCGACAAPLVELAEVLDSPVDVSLTDSTMSVCVAPGPSLRAIPRAAKNIHNPRQHIELAGYACAACGAFVGCSVEAKGDTRRRLPVKEPVLVSYGCWRQHVTLYAHCNLNQTLTDGISLVDTLDGRHVFVGFRYVSLLSRITSLAPIARQPIICRGCSVVLSYVDQILCTERSWLVDDAEGSGGHRRTRSERACYVNSLVPDGVAVGTPRPHDLAQGPFKIASVTCNACRKAVGYCFAEDLSHDLVNVNHVGRYGLLLFRVFVHKP